MVSYLLAKRMHAPNLTIIALNGGFIDIDVHPMSLSAAEPLEFGSAKVFWGGDETYHWYYQRGRITHEVITAAQLDRRGRTNNAWIQSGEKRIRLPGQGGMADVANLHRNFTLYLARHTRERFVEAVDFCTAARGLLTDEERRRAGLPPGKVRVITELCIFELDHADRIFHLTSLHPQVALEEVRDRTGGELLVSEALATTEPPSPEELRLMREEIDPFGIASVLNLQGKADDPPSPVGMGVADLTASFHIVGAILAALYERNRTGVLGGAGLAVSTLGVHRDVAVEYAAYVANRDCQRKLYVESGGQPGRRSAWTDDAANHLSHGYFRATLPVIEHAWLRPRHVGFAQYQIVGAERVARFVAGSANARETLAELDRSWRTHRRG